MNDDHTEYDWRKYVHPLYYAPGVYRIPLPNPVDSLLSGMGIRVMKDEPA